MTVGNLVVLGIVVAVIAIAILVLIRDHRSGKCSCGCDECSGCCSKCIEVEDKKD